jgi:hypothetical protein
MKRLKYTLTIIFICLLLVKLFTVRVWYSDGPTVHLAFTPVPSFQSLIIDDHSDDIAQYFPFSTDENEHIFANLYKVLTSPFLLVLLLIFALIFFMLDAFYNKPEWINFFNYNINDDESEI